MVIQEMIEKKRYTFARGFADWRDAVRAACLPLLADGTIEPSYPDAIIAKVEELGPYIVIAPKICIPHAQEGVGVNGTAVCLMKTEEPVRFSDDPEQDARLFFVLASADNEVHLQNLCELSEMLSDESVVEALLCARTAEDLRKLMK